MFKANEQRQNLLASQVECGKFSSRGRCMSLDEMAAMPTFQLLSLSYFCSRACGIYQLQQAKSYKREHLTATGEYRIDVHKDADDLIRVRIQSRHVSDKKYFLWVRNSDSENGDDPTSAWYCQCKADMRIVGCCANVASVLWYWGYNRYVENREDGTRETYIRCPQFCRLLSLWTYICHIKKNIITCTTQVTCTHQLLSCTLKFKLLVCKRFTGEPAYMSYRWG